MYVPLVSDERPVLLIDGLNAYIRAWSAYPQLNANGEPFGGCIGFLKIMSHLVEQVSPTNVYVCWEAGGSQRRRALFKEYKLGRRPEKLNRWYEDDIPSTEDNRRKQNIILLNMLKCVPVCQVYVPDCEADDTIAYLCRGPFRNKPKVIATSDKDMYQLLDENTNVYSLYKKTFVTPPDVLERFRVTASNFAIAKALVGDEGDNVPGIKGFGFKKVATLFPFLGLSEQVVLDDVFGYCHTHMDKSKLYERVLEQEADVRRNFRLVMLDGSMLSATQQAKVDATLEAFEPSVDKIGLIKHMVKNGIGDFDANRFFYPFYSIQQKGQGQ